MSQPYEYTDSGAVKLTIQPSLVLRDGAYVEVDWPDSPVIGRSIHLPAAERQAAAQALAGDRYEVVEKLADWEREFLEEQSCIDPVDVKVGDVVEVEAADGSWLVRGEVVGTDERGTDYPLQIAVDMHERGTAWPCTPGNAVRRVSRAEPDPAEQEIQALTDLLYAANGTPEASEHWKNTPGLHPARLYAEYLHARGVRVTGGERS